MTDIPHGQPAPAPTEHHAPPWLWQTATFFGKHLATAALAVTILGTFAHSWAEDFIEDTVAERIDKIEEQMSEVQKEQAVIGADMKNIRESQQDMKRDTRMILQSLQRRELREAE